ncbi:uncharacterized protein LOC127260813 isoform X3 [Andrographis paniculata]|uniref:uncharacterized protein LOC127260813 isoform X3 n=2 Tax=Andrographis paniculata TaxID=175694 RepID=UPI0021E9260C|nr:uncharacterized protein LOC127260813 isoform X3 [Andrographis paniculata]
MTTALSHCQVNFSPDPKSKSFVCSLLIVLSVVCSVYFLGTEWLKRDPMRLSRGFGLSTRQQHVKSEKYEVLPVESQLNATRGSNHTRHQKCNDECRPIGTEALPEGIISEISNLEMHPLWGPLSEDKKSKPTLGLLAIAAGIGQKGLVSEIVKKFLQSNFTVMLFHYDNVVDSWHDLEWSDQVIHVAARNQTKWWFAKRFLHPDIIANYDYIFLWDEDLGVENFHPQRYLSIVKEEGLEISQPALNPSKSAVYHPITVRREHSRVHRRYYKFKGSGKCDGKSMSPPCVGWVELMAPVFSKMAWRCAWYMIQNDLIHAWGLDLQLGYCAQGDRTAKVGVVDEEYIVHLGLPTLGGFSSKSLHSNNLSELQSRTADMYEVDNRSAVRRRSHEEMLVFERRWKKAREEDRCWSDPFN